jgi:hypothetical protein
MTSLIEFEVPFLSKGTFVSMSKQIRAVSPLCNSSVFPSPWKASPLEVCSLYFLLSQTLGQIYRFERGRMALNVLPPG